MLSRGHVLDIQNKPKKEGDKQESPVRISPNLANRLEKSGKVAIPNFVNDKPKIGIGLTLIKLALRWLSKQTINYFSA